MKLLVTTAKGNGRTFFERVASHSNDVRLASVNIKHAILKQPRKRAVASLKPFSRIAMIPPESIAGSNEAWSFFSELADGRDLVLNGPKCFKFIRRDTVMKTWKGQGIPVPNTSSRPLRFPFIARELYGHGGTGRPTLIRDKEQQDRFLKGVKNPLFSAFIDVSQRGKYLKYRSVIIGDTVVPRSIHESDVWISRQDTHNPSTGWKKRDLDFLANGDPNEDTLLKAAKSLNVDFGAIDYSYTKDGSIVLWELTIPFAMTRKFSHYIESERKICSEFLTLLENGYGNNKTSDQG